LPEKNHARRGENKSMPPEKDVSADTPIPSVG